jgi:hypothetical protein
MGRLYPGYSHFPHGKMETGLTSAEILNGQRKTHYGIDLHGNRPSEIINSGVFERIVRQTWEMGQTSLCFHSRPWSNRGMTPGFVNTNSGYFGLEIRKVFRHGRDLRQWIHHTTLNCSHPGKTCVRVKKNLSPTRSTFDPDLIALLGGAIRPEG